MELKLTEVTKAEEKGFLVFSLAEGVKILFYVSFSFLPYEAGQLPKLIKFTVLKKERVDTRNNKSEPAGDVKIKAGLEVALEPNIPASEMGEQFFIRIMATNEINNWLGEIIKPLNIPICPLRASLEDKPEKKTLLLPRRERDKREFKILSKSMQSNIEYEYEEVGAQKITPGKWPELVTFVGLETEQDYQLADNSWFVKFTKADEIEIMHYMSAVYRNMPLLYNSTTHAICFKGISKDQVFERSLKVLQALRLFKVGYVELGLQFNFGARSFSFTLQDKPPIKEDFSPLKLKGEELEEFKLWLEIFRKVEIAPDSILGRALNRFERAYNKGEVYERVTDSVIALETLLMVGQTGEISYRVGQRASFLMTDEPGERTAIAKKVKEAYNVRSTTVHSGAGSSKANEEMAEGLQELLRKGIRKIIEGDEVLRKEFCTAKNNHDSKAKFYEALVNFGNFKDAITYWRNGK